MCSACRGRTDDCSRRAQPRHRPSARLDRPGGCRRPTSSARTSRENTTRPSIIPARPRKPARRFRRLIHCCLAPGSARPAGSAPTATPRAAASCRRCPCRAGCGPAVRSSFQAISRSATTATRTSRIADVALKEGRTGALCFVTVEHRLEANGALVLEERQDIVYREPRRPARGAAKTPPLAEQRHAPAPDEGGRRRCCSAIRR